MDQMLDLSKRTYWSSWREHLDRNFPEPQRGRLHALLRTIVKSPDGATPDTLLQTLNRGDVSVGPGVLRELLDTLLADGYLEVETAGEAHRYRFRMNLLREWWQRYVIS